MDRRREDLIASFLLLLLSVVIIVGIVQWVKVEREIKEIHQADAQMTIGTDRKLAETVQSLESTLKERIEYQFDVSTDPLDMTKVITSRKFLEKLGVDRIERMQQTMRLAATVVGSDGSGAIVVRYLGRNHILHKGDMLAGWRVVEIGTRTATLEKQGARRVLKNRPAVEGAEESGLRLSVLPGDTSDPSSYDPGNY